MEELWKKISLLPPEMRREVEDFVDFLIQKSNCRSFPGMSGDACDTAGFPGASQSPVIPAEEIVIKPQHGISSQREEYEKPLQPECNNGEKKSQSDRVTILEWID